MAELGQNRAWSPAPSCLSCLQPTRVLASRREKGLLKSLLYCSPASWLSDPFLVAGEETTVHLNGETFQQGMGDSGGGGAQKSKRRV